MTDYPADGPIPVDALPEDLAAAPGLTVLDVRDPGEWDLGHAPGAVHLPLPDLPVRFEEIDLDAQVYVICRGGGRSEQAVRYLETVGIEAAVVDGGMIAWASAGRPVVRPDGSQGAV
ncbi:rhodanese-like domain-containing protein [Tsukamurella tyrosinosolvens]|uniref:Rhodanese-related sulfurtransferase n=1 Tax=Tsukamurella tyrosinosolvens TaxID=57704 RepID=A0A1H4L6Z1_TSUTY|nr:rhodanese-like domain-containing protein [Tsukamurella tyrosinosolvens]MCA4996050.1 rhodanese-like domain-containing protein [Tsukamurella tyrosinosolvens]MEC4615173.1 rhodanese-like domain-containing protein [Tsukamurella tyrosinosolvens]WEL93480.1 rhodanese-like domain-containing protein [Tsukamurella tyrosinosolvens]SEB66491.1 Rhodanese-related sulfurtransferase [Tsukamurella tyrosinosolvens]VEH93297.1 Thiosulfate sulfurtransferase glpE [Tsukamurella tyrosinosolvens]